MLGIRIGDLHTYYDMKLILVSKEIGSPKVKIKKLDIEGADSSLDYTDFFGEPKYEDLTHKVQFETIEPQSEFLTQFSRIKNAVHGKKDRIILDDDPSFFYKGRCSVSSFTTEKGVGRITIECDCEPYKYKLNKTTVSKAAAGTQDIILTNGRKRAVPEVRVETESTMRIIYQTNHIWTLGSGSFTLPELELVEGGNVVTVIGTGTVTFTWQEGDL